MKRKFAVLTSGGDAPGMNAAIRSIVRVACSMGHEVSGVHRGYQGLITGDFLPLGPRDVSQILEKGGTILRTARSDDFRKEVGQLMATAALERNAIEKIRDTADSHERFFLVEVMGRHAGFIALEVAITCGAEDFLVPEVPFDLKALCEKLHEGRALGKTGSMLVVAEGAYKGGVHALAQEMAKLHGDEFRICVLGHVQRGGSPTAADRLVATRLGAYAVEAAVAGERDKMIGESAGRPVLIDIAHTFTRKKALDPWTIRMAPCLSLAGGP